MILVGLAGWGDHDALYAKGVKPADKLPVYSRHFPVVEVDSTFYAVPSKERMAAWTDATPDGFRFVVKAYQGMTGHLRGKPQFASDGQMYGAFRDALEPMIAAGKLLAVLFQYPPWFDCTRAHVDALKSAKERMAGIPCALEFRHRSWFGPAYRDKTLSFMEREKWIHSICDEPQAGEGSVPTVLHVTDPEATIVRMHGRNTSGWNRGGETRWREVRYLYNYSDEELAEWKDRVLSLREHTRTVCVIFNNNSGGHAAGNAKRFMAMLGMAASSGGAGDGSANGVDGGAGGRPRQ